MKQFLLATIFLLGCAFSASATEITVGSSQWLGGSYHYAGSTASLRLYYSQGFLSNTNVSVVGGAIGSNGFYKIVPCTITSATLSCASFTIQSTQDSNKPSTRFFAVLYDQSGARRETLMGDASGWQVPASPTSTTVAQLLNAQGTGIVNPPVSYLNSQQVQALINTAVGTLNDASDTVKGRTKLSVAPASATNPIAVGDNDARLNEDYNASSFASLSVAIAAMPSGGATLAVSTSMAANGVTVPSYVHLKLTGASQLTGSGTVTIVGAFEAPNNKRVFGSGLTVSFSGNHSFSTLYPEWWGAIADGSTDSFAAFQAAEKALETLTSGTLNFLAGSYLTSAAIQITHVKGITWHGAGPDFTRISATGGTPAVQTKGCWRSRFEGIYFSTSVSIAAAGVFELDGELDGSFGTQGNTFINCYFNANLLARFAFIINRQAGSFGQGSENFFLNNNFDGGTVACYYQTGFNALNNTLKGGNFQNYPKDGIAIDAGDVSIDSVGFQSAYVITDPVTHNPQFWIGYQVLNGGWDIHVGESGVGERIVVQGCRSESLQFFKGSGTQQGILIGNVQNTAANTSWSALSSYHLLNGTNGIEMLKQVTVSGSSVWRLFTLTTAGTSGAVEPVWSASGAITDGSAVWTQVPFYSVDTISISADQQPNFVGVNNVFLTEHFAGWADPFINAGATITSSFTIARENLSHPVVSFYVDATGGNVTITAPILAANQILILKKVDTTANTVTLAGTGGAFVDGGASLSIPGGSKGFLVVQYSTDSGSNSFNVLGKSFGLDATTLSGATFASPGAIGGSTPAAITGTSLTITGTPISTSSTMLLGAPMFLYTGGITTATIGTSAATYLTPGNTTGGGESLRQTPLPASVLRNLRVNLAATSPAAGTVVITVRKNGVDTAITITITAGTTTAVLSDLTHSVTFAAGDKLSISVTNNDASNTFSILGSVITLEAVRQ